MLSGRFLLWTMTATIVAMNNGTIRNDGHLDINTTSCSERWYVEYKRAGNDVIETGFLHPLAENALCALDSWTIEVGARFFSGVIDYHMKHMTKFSFSGAFSTGIGLATGLIMAQYAFRAIGPPEKTAKQVIICLRCDSKNPEENKFCGQCGQALYPLPPVNCPRCMATMSSKMNFCGRCGSQLK